MSEVSKFFKRISRKKKINKALEVVDSVGEYLVKVGSDPKPLDYVSEGLESLCRSLYEKRLALHSSSYILIEGMEEYFPGSMLNDFIYNFLLLYFSTNKITLTKPISATVIELGLHPIFLFAGGHIMATFESNNKEAFKEIDREINKALCEHYGNFWEISSKGDPKNLFRFNNGESFYARYLSEINRATCNPYESLQVSQIQSKILKYRSKSQTVSLLLHGESHLDVSKTVEGVLSVLDCQVLFIDPRLPHALNERALGNICRYALYPIIYVKGFEIGESFEFVDWFCKKMKNSSVPHILVGVVSTGSLEKFDYPNFNEHIEITSDKVDVSEFPSHIQNQLEMWPSGFVEELKKRIDILGDDCIEAEFEVLNNRIAARS